MYELHVDFVGECWASEKCEERQERREISTSFFDFKKRDRKKHSATDYSRFTFGNPF